MISKWKQEFLERSADVFESKSEAESGVDPEKLYAKIGQLEMENDFLKKSFKKTGL
jgi:transposase